MRKSFYSIGERFQQVFELLSEDSNFIGCYSYVCERPCTIFEVSDISFYQLRELMRLKVHFTIFGGEHSTTVACRYNVVQLWFGV